jgi:RND family efflux transporter MFP subunit
MPTEEKLTTGPPPGQEVHQAQPGAEEMLPHDSRPRRGLGIAAFLVLGGAAIVLGVVVYSGIHSRVTAQENLKVATDQAAILTVNVEHPKLDAPTLEIVLPGNTQPFIDSPIYARTNGYLRRWYFDIGSRVKKGQLLAEIDAPEIDQQLQQARAELQGARGNLDLAKTTAERLQSLVKTGSVSQQETDTALGDLKAKQSSVESNSANVRRLEQLQSFEKVYVPFDGVITSRSTDIGALIDAGANAPGKELFHLAAIDKLRVFVAVPEAHSRAARPGATANLTLVEFPGETFHGTLVRNANAIDPAARTLLVEVDVSNRGGKLLPGAYVQVHLKLPAQIRSVTVPGNTLLFRAEGLRVAVVRDGKVELVPVTIGRDYGNSVEIVAGLDQADQVILDPPDSLLSGTAVQVAAQQSGGDGQ